MNARQLQQVFLAIGGIVTGVCALVGTGPELAMILGCCVAMPLRGLTDAD